MSSLRFSLPRSIAALSTLAVALLLASLPHASALATLDPRAPVTDEVPTELFEVVKVVDGDTVHIMRAGKKEKLRLLSVDTEEKLTPGMQSSPSKPQTIFGEETRLWTSAYMDGFRDAEGVLSIGLSFPGGVEARDVYGRLLCHVVMADGTDFNLLLVELGKSPYFNKYGNSLICHEDFVAAQKRAQRNKLGIWDPTTNRPIGSDTPAAVRDYARLMPWWQVRADAIDSFRKRIDAGERGLLGAEDPVALEEATKRGDTVEVFGTPDRFFEEQDGSLTVLFRSGAKQSALRVRIPADARAAFAAFDLEGLRKELRQNYVYVKGALSRGERGPEMTTPTPKSWRRAGGEPE
jgi:endonuclease YncB( thermonuclease family)